MIYARFYVSKKECGGDYRPVKWPIKYPYWCSGENNKSFVLVGYFDSVEEITELWPEAAQIDVKEVDGITFTTRFPKPSWYQPSENE